MTAALAIADSPRVLPFPESHPAGDSTPRELKRFGCLYSSAPAMQTVCRMIEKVAPTTASVLVTGESGSGKELVAKTVHLMSRRAAGPFISVNCGAIPATLIEAELFGHEKGAFTGASHTHRGHFERAARGTLLLDEITEMSPETQVRLLRVLETGRFARVGGEEELHADTRVVAATNRDPVRAVKEGRLREDLYYRLAVFPLQLPPLRARGEDIELLAYHFLTALNREAATAKTLSDPALRALQAHPWPGNVRELKNSIQRAFILADDVIEPVHLSLAWHDAPACNDGALRFEIGTPLAKIEKQAILATLGHCRGHRRRSAELLGVSLKTLYNRLAEYRLDREQHARPSASG